MAASFNSVIRNAYMDTITSQAGPGAKLRVYNGTRPTTGGGALSGNTLLAEIALNATAFAPASVNGTITVNAAAGAATAAATGTASWARIVKSDGTTWVMDLDVGTDITVSPTAIQSGAQVTLTSGSFAAGNA
jgi:arylamine N-acetyltransferase